MRFDLRTGSLSQNLPNFNAGTAEIFVVILEKTGNQDVTIDSGPNSADVSNDAGIHKVDLPAAFSGNITNGTVETNGGSARGFVLIGAAQELPNG